MAQSAPARQLLRSPSVRQLEENLTAARITLQPDEVIAARRHDNAGLREGLAGRGAVVACDERRASRTDTGGPCRVSHSSG
ncbi:hypothetical protein ACQ4WX_38460 [Streptomyces lasalocidi]|uniref:hypothetical protein n=1 Tax=Streptomyces sp. MUSC 14 TaxID=1354889 RepID=UPI0011605B97|nr:hypothetical protein [Streptomyces sp. MUSC 14]